MIHFLFILSLLVTPLSTKQAFGEDQESALDIKIQEKGLAIIHAVVDLPTPRVVVFDVLTDYSSWPILFPDGVQVSVDQGKDQWVVTDLSIPHSILPWTTRLITRSKGTLPTKVETVLVDGDYLQYEQTWQLVSIRDGKGTLAELDLTLQPKGWLMKLVPDFIYQWNLQEELEDHFEKLEREVKARNQP